MDPVSLILNREETKQPNLLADKVTEKRNFYLKNSDKLLSTVSSSTV